MVCSAFWIDADAVGTVLTVLAVVAVMVPVERWLGTRRWLAVFVAGAVLMTRVDPIVVTEMSVVFSAVALPLTYFPILVVANDPDYMGQYKNGRLANGLGVVFLGLILIAATAAIPLMIWTRMGQ